MDSSERRALMKDALAGLARKENHFVVFMDQADGVMVQFGLDVVPDNWRATMPKSRFGPPHVHLPTTSDPSIAKAVMEAGAATISTAQDAAIKARGFELLFDTTYKVYVDIADLDAIVQECEELFMLLGSSADFELDVSAGK